MVILTKNYEVSQSVLISILNQRQKVVELEKALSSEKAVLRAAEDQVVKSIEDGYRIANGQRTATVKVITKRIVRWKDAFIRHVGWAATDRLMADVEPTVYKKLEIT
ncbi:MAG: hypothetical protein ACE5IC_00065 [Candidatus Brocadiales bacterium]